MKHKHTIKWNADTCCKGKHRNLDVKKRLEPLQRLNNLKNLLPQRNLNHAAEPHTHAGGGNQRHIKAGPRASQPRRSARHSRHKRDRSRDTGYCIRAKLDTHRLGATTSSSPAGDLQPLTAAARALRGAHLSPLWLVGATPSQDPFLGAQGHTGHQSGTLQATDMAGASRSCSPCLQP